MVDYRVLGAGSTGPSSWAVDSNDINVGLEFYVTTSGCTATAIHFWIPATGYGGTLQGRIYSVTSASVGAAVGVSATITPSGTGWQTGTFSTPIPLTANQRYKAVILNVSTGSNHAYGATSAYWTTGPGASGLTNGPLTAPNNTSSTGGQDSYVYSSSATYPSNSGGGSNYWVDVTITDSGAAANPRPLLVARQAVNRTASF